MADEYIEIRQKTTNLPPPQGANYFNFAFSGPEVQMMVGYVDLHAVAIAGVGKGPGGGRLKQVEAEISHRILLSPRGFAMLRQQVEEIGKQYDQMVAGQRTARAAAEKAPGTPS